MRDVKIDYHQKWVNRHWRAIQSSYGKAPFFEFYSEEIKRTLYSNTTFLIDLNWSILTLCLDLLQFDPHLSLTEAYDPLLNCRENDLRSAIHPKKPYQATLAYAPQPYPQVFGNKFVKDLSVLDVLFCEGPNAYAVIKSGIID